MSDSKPEQELVLGKIEVLEKPKTSVDDLDEPYRTEVVKLFAENKRLKEDNAKLRASEHKMRETSHMWMVRSMSMEKAMKKAGVCWYA